MKRVPTYFLSMVLATATLAACGTPTGTSTTTQNTTVAGSVATTSAGGAATMAATSAADTTVAASSGGSGTTIRVYSSLPRQGQSKSQTDSVVNAIKMRFAEDKNQVCGGKFTIDYVDLDDATAAKGSWDEAAETGNANKAVSDPVGMVYIGTFNSGAAKLSIPVLNNANMVMISPANTYVGLTKPLAAGEPDKYYPNGKRNYTRVVTNDAVQGLADAAWAAKLGIKKVYILDDQQAYGQGVAGLFEKNAKTMGITVLGHEGIQAKEQNYTSLMTKIKDLSPDMVYFGGIVDNNAGQVLKDMRAVGMTPDKVKFMGPDGIQTDPFITAAGKDIAEGTYGTVAGLPLSKLGPKGQAFLKAYKDKYGADPQSYGPFGYEAAGVTLAALNQVCKADRAAIRDAVFATKDYDGILGKWSFDKDGDTTLQTIQGYIVKNGKWEEANFFNNGQWEK